MSVGVRCFQCKEKVQGWGTGRQHANITGHTWQPGYYCTECEKTFSSNKLCKQHIKGSGVHSKSGPSKTSTVSVSTPRPSSSSALNRSAPTQGRPVPLAIGLVAPLSSNMSSSSGQQIGSKAEDWHSSLQCTMCPITAYFSSKELLDQHLARLFTCTKCSIHFYASDKLQDHYRTSSAHPKCRECGDGFPTLTEWATHRARCPPPVPPAAESMQNANAPPSISNGSYTPASSARESDALSCDGTVIESSEVASVAPNSPLLDPAAKAMSNGVDASTSDSISVQEVRDEPPVIENQGLDTQRPQDTTVPLKVDKGKGKALLNNGVQPPPTTAPTTMKGNGAQRTAANAPSFHCRSCLVDPCVEPVATLCGHIFCHSCIVRELAARMCCPVCQRPFLVRLHLGVGS